MTTQKAGKYLNSQRKEKQKSTCFLACLPDTKEEIFCMSLLKSGFLPIKPHNLSHGNLPL